MSPITDKEMEKLAALVIEKWKEEVSKTYPPEEYGTRGLKKGIRDLRATASGWIILILLGVICVLAGINAKAILEWFLK